MNRARLFAGIMALSALLLAVAPTRAATIVTQPFTDVWTRTDGPVKDHVVNRTWMWGPEANTGALWENYAESPGGKREVQYFDKTRMEINDPNGDPNSEWYVTNGLLAKEMITGKLQSGDNTYITRSPAQVNVAGDTNDPNGPTYASFAALVGYGEIPDGWNITQIVSRNGGVTDDPSLSSKRVSATDVGAPTQHTVASVFWDFMNSSGVISTNSGTINGKLFSNPFYATGYPLTEAYWSHVLVGGAPKLVLVQVFERRVLTYTPDNPDGWKVEAGNVGLQYYNWRYSQLGFTPVPVQVPIQAPPSSTNAYVQVSVLDYPQDFAGASANISLDSAERLWVTGMSSSEHNAILRYEPNGLLSGDWSTSGPKSLLGSSDAHRLPYLYVLEGLGNSVSVIVELDDQHIGVAETWPTDTGMTDIATDSAQNVYLTGPSASYEKYTRDGRLVFSLYGPGGLDLVTGLYIDRSDHVFIVGDVNESGTSKGALVELDAAGNILAQWETSIIYNYVAVDGSGSLYLAKYNAAEVDKFDPSGQLLATIGSGDISHIIGLEVSPAGTVYAAGYDGIHVFIPAP